MHVVGFIAARMASTRYPGKPLAPIRGVPMIGHVFHRARLARTLDDVVVATCDDAILEYCDGIGAMGIRTRDTHERATDRIAEALPYYEEATGHRVDVAVLVQGDEPMLVPEMLDELVAPMRADALSIGNLISPIGSAEEFEDPNTVKAVRDRDDFALYFSREAIPSRAKYSRAVPMWKQLGLIAFRRDALLDYTQLAPTPLEEIESVDMNRVLEHGRRIKLVETRHRTTAVDTPGDLARVDALMANDPLMATYAARSAAR
ncbi:MAG: 3-deoxy-manno-octulosonate cytidylyltransferase [Gemmatimonadaceae bacterium]|nr:3-deoxy-manno-octulosonate cytidylyltransferase [Gemmatimonadaceae bacterium]NUP71829.1 3-deoxy-manno-octulosonate cytidylyltransferase [Gemmatimonadaceae bacterium]